MKRTDPIKKAKKKKTRRRNTPKDRDEWNLGEWKRYCDDLARRAVKNRDGWKCCICGSSDKQLHWDHLIARGRLHFRHHMENAITLCASHHSFDLDCSHHAAPLGFVAWMKKKRPQQLRWWMEHRNEIHKNPKITDYRDIADHLEAVIEKQEAYEWARKRLGGEEYTGE
jgi:hypothetical protein